MKNCHVSSILVVNDLLSDPLAYGQRKKSVDARLFGIMRFPSYTFRNE